MHPTGKKDAFETLGISPDSDQATIEATFRALIRSYRPEMAREDHAAAMALLNRIDAAFDLLQTKPSSQQRDALRRTIASTAQQAVAKAHAAPQTHPAPRSTPHTKARRAPSTAKPRRTEPEVTRIARRPQNSIFSNALRAMSPDARSDVVIYV
ncbi:hypothetical protein E4Z66_06510 [Aliishimia ponticola]|uniref:J domain-containing protein n=1 Tax=Aliishimia ponticola TaxID=2499833 RepID=A0A4S4NDI9_9RHOB|nr:hypothetical protein [Aliishimia ponticola]THH36597.1 hypothetical protein E4Z66_06510 [Aliishimia ponticola]